MEIEHIADITSRLIVNRPALKTRAAELNHWIDAHDGGRDTWPLSLFQQTPASPTPSPTCWPSERAFDNSVDPTVADILADVRTRGDAAVMEYTAALRPGAPDHGDPAPGRRNHRRHGRRSVDPDTLAALNTAAQRIWPAFTKPRGPDDLAFDRSATGVRLGQRHTPVEAVGLYVPGGTAAYPSSVLMNAIPAKVAGVSRLAMAVPTPDGVVNPLVMAAARLAEVDEIWRVGGAQAIGALAYGTATINPVDKIVGPGNAYFVASAKKQVFGSVGIDMIAGPSEILVVADGANDPAWIAADLLSQAEHDTAAQAILITDDDAFAPRVREAVDGHLATLPRAAIARESWTRHGAIIIVGDLLAKPRGPGRSAGSGTPGIGCRRAGCAGGARPPCRGDLPGPVHTPKPWAIMSAAPTTCCRPRAGRASRPGWACWTS